jgi:GNAT superfamily N-acetyltransferase
LTDWSSPLRFAAATPQVAAALAELHTRVAMDLTARYGKGHWSNRSTEKGVLFSLRSSQVCAGWSGERLVATLTLATKKPWAIDRQYFAPSKKPLYLTGMAVEPELQRRGIGRRCIAEAVRLAGDHPSDAIRLDAYAGPAGAAGFYRAAGFREVGQVTYRGTPLVYFEMLL